MKRKTVLWMVLGALAANAATAGDLAVSAYWQDHMVLQRGKPITVWGKDAAGRTVTVSFAGQNANATTGSDGFWETTFAQPFALSATPQALTITDSASESITLSDILVGDVFLAAGQSNMDRRLDYKDFHEPQSVKDFCRDDDGIRFIRIARSAENATSEKLFDLPPIKPVDDTIKYYGEGFDWAPATMDGATSNKYHVSSVALNFAHYIRRANAEKGQDIPIGIIHASSGGSAIREWIAPSVLSANGYQTYGSTGSSDGWYWNNMMAPILRAKFRAVLWYQGCTDAAMKADDYKALMDVLVKDRRDRWGESGDLPFYAVQIAAPNYNSASGTIGLDKYPAPTEDNVGHNYVRVREAQRLWNMSDTGTHGLVTIVDCVDCLSTGSLHPTDKNFVGRRLSLLARRDIYGEPDLPAEGPVFTRAVREADGSVRVFFKSGTAKGLTAGRMKPASSVSLSQWVKKGTDPIRGFALCGSDNVWKDADATVEGETIVLRANGVPAPTKFHYGYWCVTRETLLEDGQRLNLYNEAGLPMSPVAPQTVEDASSSAKVADPVLAPASCFFSPSTNVTIVCATSGATIRYTLDGSEPTVSSAAYAAPITLSATTTVKARAFAANKDPSDIVFATYTLGEAPAPEPDPLWEPGMYKFAEWTPLANNLLAGQTTTYTANSLYPWNGSVACLTDGEVSANLSDESVGIGIRSGSTLSWSFATAKTIESIRLTACGLSHIYKYDKILVVSVEVLQDGVWNQIGDSVAFNGLASYGSDQSVYVSLADEVTGHLATNVTGLRITFGDPKGLGYCRYGEIEASGHDSSGEPPATVASPTFSPAPCSFHPSTNVTITCATAGAAIRYTLDGSSPTASSAVYSAPITVSATTTVKARAYATDMNPSAIVSATYTYTEPSIPPDDPPGVSERTWTTGDYDPSGWTSLSNNLLAGLTAVAADTSKIAFDASKDLSKLTDGAVSATADSAEIVGLLPGAELVWTFDGPKVLEKIRFSSLWTSDGKIYAGINVKDILVKTSGLSDWVSLGVSVSKSGLKTAGGAQCALLSDPGLGYLAPDVVALKVVAGSVEAFANYYGEIEAVGRVSSAAYPPALGALKIKPWGTSVEFSGSIASVGTSASSCDVYLAYGSDADHLGEPVKIHSGNLGAFHYELEGLALTTAYSYRLSVSNNAATVMGCKTEGSFTTTGEVHPDWSSYKWAVIGDSLTDPTLAPGIGNYYYNFVAADTGIQLVYTNGVGSTGYKNKYNVDGGKCFYQRLQASPLPSDVDVVTIFGSVNDWGQAGSDAAAGEATDSIDDGKDTLAAYMNKAIDVIQEQAPDAKIVLVGSLYYYNVVASSHERANETLRAVAAQRGVVFNDWLTEDPDDPLDFHHIADNPTEEGSFAQRYTRDCPTEIIQGETSFGHPSAEYHEVWLSPHFRGVLTEALGDAPAAVATPSFSPASCSFFPTTNVTLACTTVGATIRYTLDGSDPTAVSTTYTEPISLSATTTVKARAFADGMNPSGVASATYTLVDPSTPSVTNGTWTTSEFEPSVWSALTNNLLLNQTGTLTGTKSYMTSDITKITDGTIPSSNAQVADTFGFAVDATVDWTFDGPKTLQKIRFTTCYIAGSGIYDDIKIAKIEVKMSGSDSWTDLGADELDYAGSNTAGTALSATLENTMIGYLAQNVTALRITFGQQNNVAQYYAEIEAVGTASGENPPATVASPVFAPASCSFFPTTNVTLSCATAGATIRYTLDGSDPTAVSTTYTEPISLSATTTVKARAFADGMNPSAVASATYTYTDPVEPPKPPSGDKMFYIGETGYDSWADAYNAAQSGATITVGTNATFAASGNKPITIDLAGRALEWQSAGWFYGSLAIVDSVGGGVLTLAVNNRNVSSGTVDLSSLSAARLAGTGKFWTNAGTVLKFPSDMALADCTARIANPSEGQKIVVQGVTYAYNGSSWGAEGKVYPAWIDTISETATAKYDAWAAKFSVADPTAARQDAYLLNCANTVDAVAAAKAAFTVVSIAINADGTVDVGMPAVPEDGFNGAVSILGSETVGGEFHTVTTGSLQDALYTIPATSKDRFFKAALQ